MKVFCASLALAALAAAEVDTTPPVITLDMAETYQTWHPTTINGPCSTNPTTCQIGVGCSATASSHCRLHRNVLNAATGYSSVEKYSRTCPAGINTDITSCPLPDAHAYDHHDGSLTVAKKIKIMNLDGTPCRPTAEKPYKCNRNAVNYAHRAEYTIEYDAADSAGNKAEKLVFTLILSDLKPPSLKIPSTVTPATLEACDRDNIGQDTTNVAQWNMPRSTEADDNIDGRVDDDILVTLTTPNGAKVTSKYQYEYVSAATWQTIDTHILGTYTVKFVATDYAGMFGQDGKNNTNTVTHTIKVQDTTAPTIYCKAAKCAMEPGRVPESLIEKYADNAALDADKPEDCCHLCEQQQFLRRVGSVEANNAPACAYWTHDTKTKKCYLMSTQLDLHKSGSLLLSGATHNETWATGYPIQCQVRNDHECGTTYTDPGARCIDMHDSYNAMTKTIDDALLTPVSSAVGAPISIKSVGFQEIDYRCSDKQARAAIKQTRVVDVKDTTPPTISVTGQHTVEVSAGVTNSSVIAMYRKQATCTDLCDDNPTITTTLHKSDDASADACSGTEIDSYTGNKIGTYAIKYTCTDNKGLKDTACRVIVNQDKTDPVIAMRDGKKHGDIIYKDAAATGTYTDLGATCMDLIDGPINEQVKITGNNIKLNRPGTYDITYNCKDSSGNDATPLTKHVIVQDKVCPSCTRIGSASVMVEASYPYSELGATCTDAIGFVDPNTDTVVTNLPVEIVGAVDHMTPGTYTLEYKAKDGSGNWNTGDIDDEATKKCTGAQSAVERVVTVEDSLSPVITLSYNAKPIHVGDGSAKGHGNVANLAADPNENPYLTQKSLEEKAALAAQAQQFSLMAEQGTGANAWMLAAAASAVTGLALLSYGRRVPVTTSVPV
jgi:hypothetical protein